MKRIALSLLPLCSTAAFAQYPQGPPPDQRDQRDRGQGGDWNYNNGDPGNWDRSWNNRPFPRSGACFFTDRDFRGNRFCVRAGDRINRLPGNIGDHISSMQTFGRGGVKVFEDRNFSGHSQTLRGNIPDLRQVPVGNGHTWNDRISSIAAF